VTNPHYHEKTKVELDTELHMKMGSRRLLERLWNKHPRIIQLLTRKNGDGNGR
jgi:hypothetical protein